MSLYYWMSSALMLLACAGCGKNTVDENPEWEVKRSLVRISDGGVYEDSGFRSKIDYFSSQLSHWDNLSMDERIGLLTAMRSFVNDQTVYTLTSEPHKPTKAQ